MNRLLYFSASLFLICLGFFVYVLVSDHKPLDLSEFDLEKNGALQSELNVCKPKAPLEFPEGFWGPYSYKIRDFLEKEGVTYALNDRKDLPFKIAQLTWKGKEKDIEERKLFTFSELFDETDSLFEHYTFYWEQKGEEMHLFVKKQQETFFSISLKSKGPSPNVKIGEESLDALFLQKMNMSWYGPDLFLQRYAFDEYPQITEQQRLCFQKKERPYFCLVQKGDLLTFEEGEWKKSENSQAKPLMWISQICEKEMKITLWDASGFHKQSYTLYKSSPSKLKELPSLKWVGQKSFNEWKVEHSKSRFILQEGDWWLIQNGQWIKINTTAQIENYLEKNEASLFVVEKLIQDQKDHFVQGTLIDPTKSLLESKKVHLKTH